MKLIYMEITHNTDDSVGDLSSLVEGEEWGGNFFPRLSRCLLSWTLSANLLFKCTLQGSGHVRPSWGYSHQCVFVSLYLCVCVCDGEHACELLSLCWPYRALACLSGSHWSIMLSDCPEKSHYSETTQHISTELQVSLFCAALVPHHPWTQMSCLQWPW